MAAPMSIVLRTKVGGRLGCYLRFVTTSTQEFERRDEGKKRDLPEKKEYRFMQQDVKVFRKFQLKPSREDRRPYVHRDRQVPEPGRETRMKTDQDWTSVWPTAQSFRWSAVPVPFRQGTIKSKQEGAGDGTPPTKFGNMELMKIPNFLHLTPKHISKQCKALKQFCTPWPHNLAKINMRRHFPMSVVMSDYCFSSPSIRDPRSRGVTVQFQLDDLNLDKHARDKFIRLVDTRYNTRTGIVTIVSDRCPLKKQNYDYCMYLLTALYYESWKVEKWESEKSLEDMEEYIWDINPSKVKVVDILQQCQQIDKESSDCESQLPYLKDASVTVDTIQDLAPVKTYTAAVEDMHNKGETRKTLEQYKQSVLRLLHRNTEAPPP